MASPSILKTILRGLVTSLGLRVIAMGMRFIVILLLPLWLSPQELGFTALALVFVNLSITFADFGYGTTIIKEKEVTQTTFQAVFSLVTLISVLLAVAMILTAPAIESGLGLPQILAIIAAFAIPFNGLAIVPNAILQRELRFTNLAIRDLVGEIAFSLTTLILAIQGFGAFSIAFAVVIQRAVRWAIASISVQWAPKIILGFSELKRLFHFSFYQFLALSMVQIFNQIDKLLLAAYLSPTSLGFYSQAQQFSVTPVQSLTGTASNVFFASFSKVQDEEETIQKLFIKITRGFLIVTGLAVGCLAPAMHLVPILYNESWRDAVPVAIALCATLPVFCANIYDAIMNAIGGEKRRVLSSIVKLVMLVVGCIVLFALFPDFDGPIIMACILGISTLCSVIINIHFICKRLHFTLSTLKPLIIPAVIGLSLYTAGLYIAIFVL